ncbi:hypothetical protein [Celerinatantimonas yamalensis]|uniref:Uncharacterized protein n=1 Tax=Celerinatantimonas yamalensis TaxID=559956 RepID=A0ABW9G5D0_9GAMM
MANQVLFLSACEDGRSRIAEDYFNQWCLILHLPYQAECRILTSGLNQQTATTLSSQIRQLLLGITPRSPTNELAWLKASYQELLDASYLFALDQFKPNSLIEYCYPELAGKVRYLDMGDEEIELVSITTDHMMNQIDQWIAELARQNEAPLKLHPQWQ